MSNVALKRDYTLEDIGKCKDGVISDGVNDLLCTYIDINGARLCSVNGLYYVDTVHSLNRLTEEIASTYGIDKFFDFIAEEKPKRTRGKRK